MHWINPWGSQCVSWSNKPLGLRWNPWNLPGYRPSEPSRRPAPPARANARRLRPARPGGSQSLRLLRERHGSPRRWLKCNHESAIQPTVLPKEKTTKIRAGGFPCITEVGDTPLDSTTLGGSHLAQPYCGWTKSNSHHLRNPWNDLIPLQIPTNNGSPLFLGLCRTLSIHSSITGSHLFH